MDELDIDSDPAVATAMGHDPFGDDDPDTLKLRNEQGAMAELLEDQKPKPNFGGFVSAKQTAQQRKIIKGLVEEGKIKFRPTDIISQGFTYAGAMYHLQRLCKIGAVVKYGIGQYQLREAGSTETAEGGGDIATILPAPEQKPIQELDSTDWKFRAKLWEERYVRLAEILAGKNANS